MKVETESDGRPKEELKAIAEITNNRSKIDSEYDFVLNETNYSKLIDGVYVKLQALTTSDVLKYWR